MANDDGREASTAPGAEARALELADRLAGDVLRTLMRRQDEGTHVILSDEEFHNITQLARAYRSVRRAGGSA